MIYCLGLSPSKIGLMSMSKYVFFAGSEPGEASGTANVSLRLHDATVTRIRRYGSRKFIEKAKEAAPEIQSVKFPHESDGLYVWLALNLPDGVSPEPFLDNVVQKLDKLVISILD